MPTLRLKIVPDAEPNADGIWITRKVPRKFYLRGARIWWLDVKPGWHVVAYRTPVRRLTGRRRPPIPACLREMEPFLTREQLEDHPELARAAQSSGYWWEEEPLRQIVTARWLDRRLTTTPRT